MILNKERRNKYYKEYNQRDYVKLRLKAYAKEYGQRPEVIERQRKRSRIYYSKKETKEKYRLKRHAQKELVYSNYGGSKCSLCGENRIDCLSVDHINGGGNKQRKEIGSAGLYSWLIKHNFPKGYRILCMNCNHILGRIQQKEFFNGSRN